MELVRVKFLKPVSPYMKGEMAGFPADTAAKYVNGKWACYCDRDGKRVDEPETSSINIGGVPENIKKDEEEEEEEEEIE
jgi:hypothetical protein